MKAHQLLVISLLLLSPFFSFSQYSNVWHLSPITSGSISSTNVEFKDSGDGKLIVNIENPSLKHLKVFIHKQGMRHCYKTKKASYNTAFNFRTAEPGVYYVRVCNGPEILERKVTVEAPPQEQQD